MRLGAATLLLIGVACQSSNAPDPLAGSRQAIVVVTGDTSATAGTLQRYERDGSAGPWRAVGGRVDVVVGRNGLAPEGEKREGDGRAPGGIYSLGTAFGFDDRAALRVPYRQLRSTAECVDDTASRYYNQIVDRDAVPRADWSSSEKMRTIDQYRWGMVVDYNASRSPKRGSCIFLHVWSGPSSTTAGCTAMRQDDLETLLRWLDPSANPRLVQFTRAAYAQLRGMP
ncbi:MAG TPA: L,D-transpeptidase family protein [Thermoanaerobaculia bacterium]